MILVIGSHFQGKKAYVKEKFKLKESDFSDDLYSPSEVLYDFQNLKNDFTDEEIEILLNKKAVISLETGCQVMALNEETRLHAEKVNSVLQLLAQNAEAVVRVYCGIPTALKGEI